MAATYTLSYKTPQMEDTLACFKKQIVIMWLRKVHLSPQCIAVV